jgi:hypothetical protein
VLAKELIVLGIVFISLGVCIVINNQVTKAKDPDYNCYPEVIDKGSNCKVEDDIQTLLDKVKNIQDK